MKNAFRVRSNSGFSVMELLVSMGILIPVMAAAVSLFSVGAKQNATEQSSIDANQESRAAFEMMTTEIAQAGSHRDRNTTLTADVGNNINAQTVAVGSSTGITVGDYVDVDTGANHEVVEVTAVGSNTISAIFRASHFAGAPVRLFALPYTTGVIPPAGMAANSTANVNTLRFFGDINGDATIQYVEYTYDSANNQITRSITPVTQGERNAAVVLVRNLKPNSAQFTLSTDNLGVVTAVTISMTAQNTVRSGSKYEETELASRISIPSAIAGSVLIYENRRYGGVNRIPPTPPNVTQWITS